MKNEALNRFREASQDQQVCEDLAYSLAEFILYQQKEQQMSGLATPPANRGRWLWPRQKAPLRNRFQFNNNRFKLLLQPHSIPQLRLAVLTKQGSK
jgi:hypothetical protein